MFVSLVDRVAGAVYRRNAMRRLDFREVEVIAREFNLSIPELGALTFTPFDALASLRQRFGDAEPCGDAFPFADDLPPGNYGLPAQTICAQSCLQRAFALGAALQTAGV